MVQNRYIRHILLVLFTISIIAVTPEVSEAHIDIQKPVETNDINLSIHVEPGETPLRITIPDRGININIEQSPVENGTWYVPEYAAGYAEGSSFLDEQHGNTIIFAHARRGLFRELLDVKNDDEITVIGTKNLYRYKVASIEKILPDEIDRLKSYGDYDLTLFTCEGINDEYRLLVKAIRVDTYSLSNSSEII